MCASQKVRTLSLEQFFLTVDQNNFGNKIPFPTKDKKKVYCAKISRHRM